MCCNTQQDNISHTSTLARSLARTHARTHALLKHLVVAEEAVGTEMSQEGESAAALATSFEADIGPDEDDQLSPGARRRKRQLERAERAEQERLAEERLAMTMRFLGELRGVLAYRDHK
jgi:hypothetical protein